MFSLPPPCNSILFIKCIHIILYLSKYMPRVPAEKKRNDVTTSLNCSGRGRGILLWFYFCKLKCQIFGYFCKFFMFFSVILNRKSSNCTVKSYKNYVVAGKWRLDIWRMYGHVNLATDNNSHTRANRLIHSQLLLPARVNNVPCRYWLFTRTCQ